MLDPIVCGASHCFEKLLEIADEYANTPWPVLLLGETGVGKELLARRIHRKSQTSSGPFIPVNCGAIPHSLFESELFGHERGAFSGALQSHRGLLRAGDGGSVFLDEVGELDLSLQVKLLRWLDSGEIRSVGSARTELCHTRLIAATNVDLHRAVAQGSFRLDLLERLGVLTLQIPALRERKEDIPLIAASILGAHQAKYDLEDLELLTDYDWPGNIRQLKNILLRCVIRSHGHLSRAHIRSVLEDESRLAEVLATQGGHEKQDNSLAEIEKSVIIERIRRCQGNKKKAAKELGIAKSTLHEKIKKWKDQRSWVATSGRDHARLG